MYETEKDKQTEEQPVPENPEDEITQSIKTLVRVLIAIETQYQADSNDQSEFNQAA